jgi:predicted thioesterase
LVVPLEVGLQAAIVHEVAGDDTAEALGSGDVPVLATPRLVGLAEAACVAALTDAGLAASSTTVGTRVEIEHVAAVRVGDVVRVSARLEFVDGRALRFAVVATDDGDRQIAVGTFERVVVDRERFLSRD